MFDALGARITEQRLEVACQVGSTEAVKAAVRAGLGVSFVSSLSIGDECEAGSLAVVPVRGFKVRREFHIVARETEDLSPAGRAFWAKVVAD
jgi:DNA-binding transcriptional LysR family regulator